MCFMSTPDIPDPPQPVIPKKPPKKLDDSVLKARSSQRAKEAARSGLRSAFRTGPKGLVSPTETTRKSLLGQ